MDDALVVGEDSSGNGTLEDNIRSCQLSWINRKTDRRHFNSLNDRIESVTGLSISSAEKYQIVNYGLGGHYALHLDAYDDPQVTL